MHELNLLPPVRRITQRQEQHFLIFGDVLGGIAISLGIITVVGLLIGTTLWMITKPFSPSSEFSEQFKEYQKIRATIAERNATLEGIAQFNGENTMWTTFISTLLTSMTPAIKLDSMTAESKSQKIIISGRADNRNAVIALEGSLRALPGIKSVTGPSSNLLAPQNSLFTFELVLDPSTIQKDGLVSAKQ